jgi:hypothetical protein
MIRRHWCNKWIPYKWNRKKITPELVELKQRIILSNVKQYPIIVSDDLTTIIPIDELPGYIKELIDS